MKTVMGQTKTAKGLTYLNLLSILAMVVFIILLPIINTFAETINSRLIYALSIIFIVFNLAFYIVPQHLKIKVFKYRMLVVYLPTILILAVGIWNPIAVIINLRIGEVFTLIFSLMTFLQPCTFSLLISKLVSDQPTLLG